MKTTFRPIGLGLLFLMGTFALPLLTAAPGCQPTTGDDDDSTASIDDDDATGDDDDATAADDAAAPAAADDAAAPHAAADAAPADDDDDDDDATWPGWTCPGDDSSEPNDTWDTAAALPPTGAGGAYYVLCPQNEDYFLAGDDDDSAVFRVTSLNGSAPVMIRTLNPDTGWITGEYPQGANGYAITSWWDTQKLVQIVQESGDAQVDYRVNLTFPPVAGDP